MEVGEPVPWSKKVVKGLRTSMTPGAWNSFCVECSFSLPHYKYDCIRTFMQSTTYLSNRISFLD
jgi:hypothetical protein